jgi:hypothetical protein
MAACCGTAEVIIGKRAAPSQIDYSERAGGAFLMTLKSFTSI